MSYSVADDDSISDDDSIDEEDYGHWYFMHIKAWAREHGHRPEIRALLDAMNGAYQRVCNARDCAEVDRIHEWIEQVAQNWPRRVRVPLQPFVASDDVLRALEGVLQCMRVEARRARRGD